MFPEFFPPGIVRSMVEHVHSTPLPVPASTIAGDGWQRPLPGLTTETATPSISELIEVIGEDATVKLCDVFGGISREIGKPAKAIVTAIGTDAASRLHAYWGRGRIYIPRRALSTKARHEMVHSLTAQGLTRQAVAQRVLLSERQVYNILKAGTRIAVAAVLMLVPAIRFAGQFAEITLST